MEDTQLLLDHLGNTARELAEDFWNMGSVIWKAQNQSEFPWREKTTWVKSQCPKCQRVRVDYLCQ